MRITREMLHAGLEAMREFDPDTEEPHALVFDIIWRALEAIPPGCDLLARSGPEGVEYLPSPQYNEP